jgi:SAM-dependent methyltransferase
MTNGTQRFTSRVENYIRYRPHYPEQLVGLLRRECDLNDGSVVVDVGSGTGFLALPFLKNGNRVFGIEPNRAMREAGGWYLRDYPRFQSVDGSAEATGLPGRTADLIVSGQAFHWFEPDTAREEFTRILRPEGWIVLVWNVRRVTSDPFGGAYESLLLAHGKDYEASCHRNVDDDVIGAFFSPGEFRQHTFPNSQSFDLEGLKGRLLSASYTPEAADPGYGPMVAALEQAFDRHQENGRVTFHYDTRIYYGHLPSRKQDGFSATTAS